MNMREGYCRADVYTPGRMRSHQCRRKAKEDGYCHQHHPETVRAREEKSRADYAAAMEKSPWRMLEKSQIKRAELEERVKCLEAEIERLMKGGAK